jgi:hypothetical protein
MLRSQFRGDRVEHVRFNHTDGAALSLPTVLDDDNAR